MVRISLGLLLGTMPAAVSAEPIHLVCGGEGEASRVETTQGFASNSYGESASATIYQRRDHDFADQVNVEINGDGTATTTPQ